MSETFVEMARRFCNPRGMCTDCIMREIGDVNSANCFIYKAFYDPKVTGQIEALRKWAKDNPPPIYPTWYEWINANGFKNSFVPCDLVDVDTLKCDDNCHACMNIPIPADVAVKLGVKLLECK